MVFDRVARTRLSAWVAAGTVVVAATMIAMIAPAHADTATSSDGGTPSASAGDPSAADAPPSTAPDSTPVATAAPAPVHRARPITDPNLGPGTLTMSDTTIKSGQTVTLRGTGYPKAPTNMFVTVCKNPPTATDCNVDLSRVVTIHYKGGGSWGPVKFTVYPTFQLFGPPAETVNCAKVECVVGTTNAANPKDHAYNATQVFAVAGSTAAGTKSASGSKTTTQSSGTGSKTTTTTSTTTSSGTQLPSTGVTSLTRTLGTIGVTFLVIGIALVTVNRRRQPKRSS